MSGSGNPDYTGNYLENVLYNGKMSYVHELGIAYLWWDGNSVWFNDADLGAESSPFWARVDPSEFGVYIPVGGSGSMTFSAV